MNDTDSETTVGERVLIVEDDPATRTGLAELVQAWGFQTAEAAEGEDDRGCHLAAAGVGAAGSR